MSCDAQDLLAKALPLKGLADAVNVTDGAGARAHMSAPIAAAISCQRRHRADPAVHLPRPQPHRAAGRPDGRGGARHPQSPDAHRRRSQGRRPARHQAGVRSRFEDADRMAREHARRRRTADRHARSRATRRSSSAPPTCRSIRRPTGSRQARGQDRRRRAIRADPVLHGCRRGAPLCRAARRARRDARALPC